MLKQVENSLKSFSSIFECGGRKERLSFRTFDAPRSDFEIQEILSIFGNPSIMKYFGSQVTVDTVAQAEEWQARLRKETSFEGEMKRIRWRLYYERDLDCQDAKVVFIGFVSVSRMNRLLGPAICLLPAYQGQHLGTKVFLCLLAKLLNNKAWFFSYFDGIKMTIHPHNQASLALKEALILQNDCEERNASRPDGLWVYERRGYSGNKVKSLIRRQFTCTCVQFLSTVFDSKMMVPLNKKESELHLKLANKAMYVRMTLMNPFRVGVQQVYLATEDVRGLLDQFIWFRIDNTAGGDEIMCNTFQVELPDEIVQLECNSGRSMFLFFLLAKNELQSKRFEITQTNDRRVEQDFLVFDRLTNDIKHFRIRILDKNVEGIIGYLVHLDWDTFAEARTAAFQLKNKIRNIWSTGQFDYHKTRYRSKLNGGTNKIRLTHRSWNRD